MKAIGFLVVFLATFGGYFIAGGSVHVITDVMLPALPGEFTIIFGAAVGAFIIANSKHTIHSTIAGLKTMGKPEAYSKEDYLELLGLLFALFKMAKSKGWLALESHIENPHDSELFKQFPKFHGNHHATLFLCDYLRIISLGTENPHELEALMDEEIETLRTEKGHPSHAVQSMADGIPALGIVAAVLGIIKTMGSITEPPEVLGGLVGKALVGTFLGVWLAYGFIGPMAGALASRAESEIKYYIAIKVAVLAFLQGCAPQVSVEFARKTLNHEVQPTFMEVEEATNRAAEQIPKN
jgi:chemotaxis protein MotA